MGVLHGHDGGQQGFCSNLQAHRALPYCASEAAETKMNLYTRRLRHFVEPIFY